MNITQKQLDNLKKSGGFGHSQAQPTSAQRIAGWDRRKERMAITSKIMQYKKIPFVDAVEVYEIIRNRDHMSKTNMTRVRALLHIEGEFLLEDYHFFKYAFESKYMLDWMNKNIEQAPTKIEMTGEDGNSLQIDINFTNETED